jgi:2-oxoisovalerate dehydrogenase E1 component alpha subunit
MGDRSGSGAGKAGEERVPQAGRGHLDASERELAGQERNLPPLQLHVPEPRYRPGDAADFSDLEIPAAGTAPRPMDWSACWMTRGKRLAPGTRNCPQRR